MNEPIQVKLSIREGAKPTKEAIAWLAELERLVNLDLRRGGSDAVCDVMRGLMTTGTGTQIMRGTDE